MSEKEIRAKIEEERREKKEGPNLPIPTAEHPEVLRLMRELAGEHAERQAAAHALAVEKGVTVELASKLNTMHQLSEKRDENIDLLEKDLVVAEDLVKRVQPLMAYVRLWVLTHKRRKARSFDQDTLVLIDQLSKELDAAKVVKEQANRKAAEAAAKHDVAVALGGQE